MDENSQFRAYRISISSAGLVSGICCRLVSKKMQEVTRASLIFRGVLSSHCARSSGRTGSVSLRGYHSILLYRGSGLSCLCLMPAVWLAEITGEGHPTLPEKGVSLVKSFQTAHVLVTVFTLSSATCRGH